MLQKFKICRFTLLILLLFLIIAFGVSHTLYAQNCNDYDWTMRWYTDSASSKWNICPESIEFEMTATTSTFFYCYSVLTVVQGSSQFEVTTYMSDESTAMIHFDGSFDGCTEIRQGVKVTGWIDEFPSWFDIFSPFRIYYEDGYIDVEGSPIPPTTSSTSSISTTTTMPPITSTTSTSVSGGVCPAELIYGEDSREAEALRFVRDNILNKTSEGRELIRLYYFWSPVIITMMVNDELFKEDVRELIDILLSVEDLE